MKIFILRHEKRYDNRNYDTSLTDKGFEDAMVTSENLKNLDIDVIFTSPYRRVIQTIEPYLKSSGKKINIDFSLIESLMHDLNDDNIRNINEYTYGYQYINTNYKSFLALSDLIVEEDYNNIKKRSMNFLNFIKNNKELKDKNILIVTHKAVINAFLDYDYEDDNYEMGKLSSLTV